MDNVVPRYPGETWADAFYAAPTRTLEKFKSANSFGTDYVVEKCPNSDTVVSLRIGQCHATLWHLDMTRRKPTVVIWNSSPNRSVYFTGDGKRLIFISSPTPRPAHCLLIWTESKVYVDVYSIEKQSFISRKAFPENALLAEIQGGLIWDRDANKIYNFRTDEVIDIPERCKANLIPSALKIVYDYASDTEEAVVLAIPRNHYAVYNFHLKTWTLAALKSIQERREISWITAFDVRKNEVLETGDNLKLAISNLDTRTTTPVTIPPGRVPIAMRILNFRGAETGFIQLSYLYPRLNVLTPARGGWKITNYGIERAQTEMLEPNYAMDIAHETMERNGLPWTLTPLLFGRSSFNFVDDGYRRFFVTTYLMGAVYLRCTGPYPKRMTLSESERLEKKIAKYALQSVVSNPYENEEQP